MADAWSPTVGGLVWVNPTEWYDGQLGIVISEVGCAPPEQLFDVATEDGERTDVYLDGLSEPPREAAVRELIDEMKSALATMSNALDRFKEKCNG